MFGRPITLFKIFGFTVRMDLSWLVLAGLLMWSLAGSVFPRWTELPASSNWIYWVMGLGGAAGLLVSIVFHELSHSLVARRYGIPMKGITLFVFGGVAEMTEEPRDAKSEFLMAIAGPISSVVLAGMLFGLQAALMVGLGTPAEEPSRGAPEQAVKSTALVLQFLWLINLSLALFNLVPAFPLDGGRVLRAILWGWRKNIRWATRVASQVGAAFGLCLIGLGLLDIFWAHDSMGGIWWILIGWFVRSAARQSYQQLLMRQAMEGEPVGRFMNPDPVTVGPEVSLQELVEGYVYRHGYAMFPVIRDGQLLGSITVQQVKQLPREQWALHRVEELMSPCSARNTTSPDTDAMHVMAQMRSSGQNRIMVVNDHRLVGVITLKDLLKFLALKLELEEGPPGPPPIRIAGTRDE